MQQIKDSEIMTYQEAADFLGVKNLTIFSYVTKGMLDSIKINGVRYIKTSSVENYEQNRNASGRRGNKVQIYPNKPEINQFTKSQFQVISPSLELMQKIDEVSVSLSEQEIWEAVLRSVFCFFNEQGITGKITGLREVPLIDMRLFEVKNEETSFQVLGHGDSFEVITATYQERLRQELASARSTQQKLLERLSHLQQHPRSLHLDKYAYPFPILVTPIDNGFLISSEQFPCIIAQGTTEEQAIANFRCTLIAWWHWLGKSRSRLSEDRRKLFDALCNVFVEDLPEDQAK